MTMSAPAKNQRNPVAIECLGLTKYYRKLRALYDVSFSVPAGSIFGFLGPNGSGKSTFIKILTGLISPHSGQFSIFGNSHLDGPQIRNHIGALVDRADFYRNLTGYRNLQLLGRITGHHRRSHLDELLNLVGLYDRRNDLVRNYSQGMKQRLGLAQALLTEPNLLILDEPTTGLDPIGVVEVRQFIYRIAEEKKVTVFLSSHMLHEVEELCTHYAMIFSGELVSTGSTQDIVQNLDVVRVDLEVVDTTRIRQILEHTNLVRDIEALPNLLRVRIPYKDIPALVKYLVEQDVQLYSVAQRNRLEEFFMVAARGPKDGR